METAIEIPTAAPEAEVLAKAQRRRFTAQDKLRILKEADRDAYAPGRLGLC